MRSQKEILEKISHLEKYGADPMGIQRKHLIRKLEWNNALPWINPKRAEDEKFKTKWKETSRVDEKYLMKEMFDFMFGAYGCWLEYEAVECLVMCQYYLIWVWLMGPKEDKFLAYLFHLFMEVDNNMGRKIFDEICAHYGWKTQTFIREFEEKERNKPRIVTPDGLAQGENGLILPNEN